MRCSIAFGVWVRVRLRAHLHDASFEVHDHVQLACNNHFPIRYTTHHTDVKPPLCACCHGAQHRSEHVTCTQYPAQAQHKSCVTRPKAANVP